MKLCNTTCGSSYYGLTPAQSVEFIASTGFKHIDYSFFDSNQAGSAFLTDDWMKEVSDASSAAERLGVDFVQAHSPFFNLLSDDPVHFETGMLAAKRSIEACSYLGIRNMVLHLGVADKYTYPDGEADYHRENAKILMQLVPYIEKYNVNLCIENGCQKNQAGSYFPMTGRDINSFIDYFDHPLVHACWDVGHANLEGVDQYEEITTLGDNLLAIHFQDNMGTADEHIAPYMGTLDIDSVLQGLLAIDFKGYLTFEANNIIALDGSWPHSRMIGKHTPSRPAASPSLEVARKADELLYEIGKHVLNCYNVFEE